MKPEREIDRQIKRLARGQRLGVLDTHTQRCPEHGTTYACPGSFLNCYRRAGYASCGHIACRRILQGQCPECPAP